MTHQYTRKPGVICYQCGLDDHVHFAKVGAVVVNQGVFIAEVTATSEDGVEFTDVEKPYDMMRQTVDLLWYESEETLG